ncbi:DUF4114 domain-containing protein [Orrella daihaiensis]|uniref:Peptidase S53 domain-containing protein n=1 Tax=Orrella daihaiensis TaxID=2782176 RepID=A0ABY4AMB9_9BURK|nr:DUF4114 domain-containing protein [Orrella daihaiensis]UOD51466.1 hypothetical protein DHf2319_06480 [Orrella daihaiensis]
MPYKTLPNSTFLDLTSHGLTAETSVVTAYNLDPSFVRLLDNVFPDGLGINVGLFLPRANSPESLLNSDWATRQTTLKSLADSGQLWSNFGASQTDFDLARSYLEDTLGLTVLDQTNSNYVSSAQARSIWVELKSGSDFAKLFGTDFYLYDSPDGPDTDLPFWNGSLAVDEQLDVSAIWFDTDFFDLRRVEAQNFAGDAQAELVPGWQSIGNGASVRSDYATAYEFANNIYNFPLANKKSVQTALIGLTEPGIGSAIDSPGNLESMLKKFINDTQEQAWVGSLSTQGASGQLWNPAYDERDLDISVIASVNPTSDIRVYTGSGLNPATTGNASATALTALQSAIWDTSYDPEVISTSYGTIYAMSPDSPFLAAFRELGVDAALRNQSVFAAAGDQGSALNRANGLVNVSVSQTSPYMVAVGGTSLSTLAVAQQDPTLAFEPNLVALAESGDKQALWLLVAGGLKSPTDQLSENDLFIETLWNENFLVGTTGSIQDYTQNFAGAGGVDVSQSTPNYQVAYGLEPLSVGPNPQVGRGVPDVVASAGSNIDYITLDSANNSTALVGGTSAASPLWAALASQINAIFLNQGLPNLGYANDLLYLASAVSPGSFNDITIGSNATSYRLGGKFSTNASDPIAVTPTGYGYEAAWGYDYATGLGSPNGVLLSRALSTIAHSQLYFPDKPVVLETNDQQTLVSPVSQSLIFQPRLPAAETLSFTIGDQSIAFSGDQTTGFGWTSLLAQQVLQPDFSAELVTLFDGYSLGQMYQTVVEQDTAVSITISGETTTTPLESMTSPYGFVGFISDDAGAVNVARPVAIATTALGADDQDVIVRARQNGGDDVSVTFYRVDDLLGTIDGIKPGDAAYGELASGRAYLTQSGSDSISGPGYGQYTEEVITGVDAGDIIAMTLTNGQNTFFGFAAANEKVDGQSVVHLRNYGLNTWGWEDLYGGGDFDFNDLIIQLDFTSTAGAGLLV